MIFFLDDDAYLIGPVLEEGIEVLLQRCRRGRRRLPDLGGHPRQASLRRAPRQGEGLCGGGGTVPEGGAGTRRPLRREHPLVRGVRPLGATPCSRVITWWVWRSRSMHHRTAERGRGHAGWKLRNIAAGRLRCILTRFRWRRASLMAGRVLLSVGWAGLRAGRVAPVPLAIADTVRSLPGILAERSVVPISVEEYFFRPNPLEDEYSVPLWRKLAGRVMRAR